MIFLIAWLQNINCWFSLTWSTAIFFNENKRKRLHNNRVEFLEDLVGAPTWPPFLCLGAPSWWLWRHVKTENNFASVISCSRAVNKFESRRPIIKSELCSLDWGRKAFFLYSVKCSRRSTTLAQTILSGFLLFNAPVNWNPHPREVWGISLGVEKKCDNAPYTWALFSF